MVGQSVVGMVGKMVVMLGVETVVQWVGESVDEKVGK